MSEQPPKLEPEALPHTPVGATTLPADPKAEKKETVVTPFEVSGTDVIDYEKLLRDFGTKRISPEMLERFEKVTGHKPHVLMRRGMFFSHRDFDKILDLHEKGKPFYLYTGRGPSSDSMHLGHMIPFTFTK
jgi:tryptophanyl-tRNA synthetase